MTRDDIIRMAIETGGIDKPEPDSPALAFLERFAALVAAAERENMIKEGWRRCAVNQRTTQFCGMLEDAVKAEREACAKVCEEIEMQGHALWDRTADPEAQGRSIAASDCADAIRARGEK